MADDSVVVGDEGESKIVTEFLLNTCRLRQPCSHHVQATALCSSLAARLLPPPLDDKAYLVPLITGSSAEFYIQPMLSCVGDVDMMYHRSDMLAIPENYPPPTELPAEFHSRVDVCETIGREYPGYVYLVSSYLLIEDNHASKYTCIHRDRRYYRLLRLRQRSTIDLHTPEIHGPALTVPSIETQLSVDAVPCVRCLSWPSQAADWSTRHRNYDWPDSATVDRVISNGCDVVQVAHPQCRQDEWMSEHQFRLSFSRAEIVLLNSLMPLQQIVYHMLRVFVKTERLTDIKITDISGTKTVNIDHFGNYHFKTLTMWTCELKPRRWWISDMNVVSKCVKLLHILADWLNNRTCPHYFVNNCNLTYNTEHLEIIINRLTSITESWLSTWFVNNYLRKRAQLCPDRVSRLFDDVSTRMKLQNAVSAVVDWRRNRALVDLSRIFNEAEYVVLLSLSCQSLTLLSCRLWINGLVKFGSCFLDYFAAVAFLHVAVRLAKRSFDDELLDVLATLVGQFVGTRRYCHQLSSELSLSQALILMKVVANNSRSTVQQIQFELSKAYLYRALRCKDSDSDSIYCLANVYLAVLYYTTGQYQTAIDHCTLVTRSQDYSKCPSHVVQGQLLPKIDDDIDTVLGLSVFFQYVRTAALNQQQTQYVSVFTTKLLAHYLYIRCLSVMKCRQFTQMSSTDKVQQLTKYIIDTDQLSLGEMLLLRRIKMLSELQCQYKPLQEHRQNSRISASELDTSELVQLLQQSAVEHLTAFRQLQAQRLGSVATIGTTDFEALYAYKRGDYQRCLHLSTQNVLITADESTVWTFPEFIQLMDDDIVSLTALTLIVNPEYRDRILNASISQLTLSLYLMSQCQLKLHHSVTSLAQTVDYIEVAQRSCPVDWTLDHLTLKLIERKIMIYLSKLMRL